MSDEKITQEADALLADPEAQTEANIVNAAKEYLRRKFRIAHPQGEFDNGGRFFLAAEEHEICCINIRDPSRSYPYSHMSHGRTIRHVAEIFDADELEVRRLAKRIEALIKTRA